MSAAWAAIGAVLADLQRDADEHASPAYEDAWASPLLDEGYRRGVLCAISDIEEVRRGHIEAVERWAQTRVEVERARLRRWQLRLRWRRDHRLDKLIDRLHYRARHHPAQNLRTGRPDWRHFSFPLTRFILAMLREPHSFPIAGPRGVLP